LQPSAQRGTAPSTFRFQLAKNIARHGVGFLGFDVFGGGLRMGKPGRCALLADVILLLAAQEGTEVHRELVGASIMIRNRLVADFVGGTVDLDGAKDLSGIEQGREHERSVRDVA
jgi:hypothetical protein